MIPHLARQRPHPHPDVADSETGPVILKNFINFSSYLQRYLTKVSEKKRRSSQQAESACGMSVITQ